MYKFIYCFQKIPKHFFYHAISIILIVEEKVNEYSPRDVRAGEECNYKEKRAPSSSKGKLVAWLEADLDGKT